MVKGVQATLLHHNSSNDAPHHHLCPPGKNSWCKYQAAPASNATYNHVKPPIPEAIVELLKLIYARLGSKELLAKCIDGYTQNANESLHSVLWKYCPKTLYLGKEAVDVACALVVCQWNDGLSSFQTVSDKLGVTITSSSVTHFQKYGANCVKQARYRVTDRAKKLRKRARRIRKGLNDANKRREGEMYSAGSFGDPGSSVKVERGRVVVVEMGRERLVEE